MVRLGSTRRILVLHDRFSTVQEQLAFSKDRYDIITYKLHDRNQFIQDLKGRLNDISAVATDWDAFVPIGGLDHELVEAFPQSLKVVALPSVGHEHVNGKLLRSKNIALCNNPSGSGDAVADIALYLALSCFRFTTLFQHSLRTHGHTLEARKECLLFDPKSGDIDHKTLNDRDLSGYPFGEYVGENIPVEGPSGQTAAIIGFGAIGQEVGKRLNVLGMKVHYFQRTQLSEEKIRKLGYEAMFHSSVESLFAVANLLVLAVPLTPETKHIVNSKTIAMMPKGGRIVNVGRGLLVDQKALVDGLKSKHLLSAGLDVYEQEPIVEPELLSRYDVTLLPHVGGSTTKVSEYSIVQTLENIHHILSNENDLAHIVN